MSRIMHYAEEIEERGNCQQRPALETGDKYLIEVEGHKRLRIVHSVHFDHYVSEDVARWITLIEEYSEEEFILGSIPMNADLHNQTVVPVFVAEEMIGVLSEDKDHVKGSLILPAMIGETKIRGVAPFGFYDCQNLLAVTFSPMVVIAYDSAFAKSGIQKLVFNEEMPVLLHTSAIDDCKGLPHFDTLFDSPFPGKYLFRRGKAFREWEEKICSMHFFNSSKASEIITNTPTEDYW